MIGRIVSISCKQVRIGEPVLAFYKARNKLDRPVWGMASYNVQPNKAGLYFNKVPVCFVISALRKVPLDSVRQFNCDRVQQPLSTALK